MSLAKVPKSDELVKISYHPPRKGWMDTPVSFRPGTWCYAAAPKNLRALGLPNPREWQPTDEDWKLPENWKEIILEGFRERLKKYRSFQLFLDICVRCGACAVARGGGARLDWGGGPVAEGLRHRCVERRSR